MIGSLRAVAIAAAVFAVVPAQAAVVLTSSSVTVGKTDVGDAFSIIYDGRGSIANEPAQVVPGLAAEATFALKSVSSDGKSWVFDYTLNNTSSGAVSAARIVAFGFNVNHALSLANSSGTGMFGHAVSSGNVPNAQPNVDICFLASGNGKNCSGGSNGGLTIDAADATGTVTFGFQSGQTSLALSNFYNRYQSLSISGTFRNVQSATGLGSVYIPKAPEPATWATMVMGFGLVGSALRRRRRDMVAA